MTYKQKAKDLIKLFSSLVTRWDCYDDAPRKDSLIIKDAIKAALICCNEVLGDMGADRGFEFWTSVKKDLEKRLKKYDKTRTNS